MVFTVALKISADIHQVCFESTETDENEFHEHAYCLYCESNCKFFGEDETKLINFVIITGVMNTNVIIRIDIIFVIIANQITMRIPTMIIVVSAVYVYTLVHVSSRRLDIFMRQFTM